MEGHNEIITPCSNPLVQAAEARILRASTFINEPEQAMIDVRLSRLLELPTGKNQENL